MSQEAALVRNGSRDQRRWLLGLALLVLAALLLRARWFGNPLIDVDEEFYLLVGERMLQGAIPYVDIWDRKPIGTFLLYAGASAFGRALGGDGILAYQLVAAVFVAATACVIAVMARRIAGSGAALFAAFLYVPALALSGGQGGQTPVFYNLPVALAARLLLGLAVPDEATAPGSRRLIAQGVLAMLLVGTAMQIKYAAMFEGMFFGCALLWLGYRARWSPAALAGATLAWIAAALLPTALARGWYAAIGQLPAFDYANFGSILARTSIGGGEARRNLARIALRLIPFVFAIGLGEWLLRPWAPWRERDESRAAHRFLWAWLLAALAGFLSFGTYFNHYALPLLPPLCVLSAPLFAIRFRGAGTVFGAIALAGLLVAALGEARKAERRRGDATYARILAAEIAPRLHGRCLFILYGDPILYHLTKSCLPSRWPFPFHLILAREAGALGVDPIEETHRILAQRPPVIVDRVNDDVEINRPVQAIVRRALHQDYRLVFTHMHRYGKRPDTDQVWERLPGR